MSRRRRNPRLLADGVLLVDKPAGLTSHDVVERLRRRFGPGKLGHAGTLDPFATGLLVLAFNQATRLVELMGAGSKLYRAVLDMGLATDTGDPTGQETARAAVPELHEAQVLAALKSLEGTRMQAPPAYSAAKHQGRPLYSYARAGEVVQKPPRPVTVHQADLLGLTPGRVEFQMLCSRGTYLRVLAEELAQALGSVGHLVSLRRLGSSPFAVDEAAGLDEALDWTPEEMERGLMSLDVALARCGLAAIGVDEDLAWQLRQGRILNRQALLPPNGAGQEPSGAFRVLSPEGGLVAVLRWLEADERKPGRDYETIRVFPARPEGAAGGETSASALGAE